MGLDMYLYARKYVSGYDYTAPGERRINQTFRDIINAAGVSHYDDDLPSLYLEVKVLQWRKANQIHGWFVDNVQGGVDECQQSQVSREQLETLLGLCKIAYQNRDPKILEPREGFFFGGTDIDEWYWKDVEFTIEGLTKVLEAFPDNGNWFENWEFYYQSSW